MSIAPGSQLQLKMISISRVIFFLILLFLLAVPCGGIYIFSGGRVDPWGSYFSVYWNRFGAVLAARSPRILLRIWFFLTGLVSVVFVLFVFIRDTLFYLSASLEEVGTMRFWIGYPAHYFEDHPEEETAFLRYGLFRWPYGFLKMRFFGNTEDTFEEVEETVELVDEHIPAWKLIWREIRLPGTIAGVLARLRALRSDRVPSPAPSEDTGVPSQAESSAIELHPQ